MSKPRMAVLGVLALIAAACAVDAAIESDDACVPEDASDAADASVEVDSGTSELALAPPEAIDLPGGASGIGFDDLRYSSAIGRVIAPGGRTGNVDLIDPDTRAVTPISGFGDPASVDAAYGLVFAVDRAARKLRVADLSSGTVVANADTSAFPDYVRASPLAREVWITEPGSGRIEVFSIPDTGTPTPQSIATIAVTGDVEGLVFDSPRRRAYTHQVTSVAVIDADAHALITSYAISCSGTHGIPVIDEARGLLFAGCSSARVVVLDLNDGGREVDSASLAHGTTILAYAPSLGHFYLRGDPGTEIEVLGVSNTGMLAPLAITGDAAARGHCMTADERGAFWVCDAAGGRLLRFTDPFAASN